MKKMGRGVRKQKQPFDGKACAPYVDEELKQALIDEHGFLRYYKVAIGAASMGGPAPATEHRVMPGQDCARGNVINVVFGDNPFSRMAIAIRNQMLKERRIDKLPVVFTRILALIRLIGEGSLRRWAVARPDDPQHLYYPDAIVLAAAVSPLNDDLTFEPDQFERLVEMRVGGKNLADADTL
jgi:hypothetical protein